MKWERRGVFGVKKFYLFILNVVTVIYSFIWFMFTFVFLTDLNYYGDIYGIIAFLIVSIPLIIFWFLLLKYRKVKSNNFDHVERSVNDNDRVNYSTSEMLTPQKTVDSNLKYKHKSAAGSLNATAIVDTIHSDFQTDKSDAPSSVVDGLTYTSNAITTENDAVPNITETKNVIKPNPNQAENNLILSFNVSGVTMLNDKNKDIQKLLRKYGKSYCEENFIELYGGYTNKDILDYVFEVSEFEGLEFVNEEISFVPEPTNEYDPNAIKVFIDFGNDGVHHIGYVPKKLTSTLNEILINQNIINVVASYVGGKIKETEYDFEKDKDVVVTKELTLGVEIVINNN